ncbi:MAG: DUF885 domain-containing protein [Kangiellaceae bacterium]|nr:DUF885 domain-containing protein [Kangiellaceae bacterium]
MAHDEAITTNAETQQLHQLFEEVYQWDIAQNPVFAARMGDDKAKGKLRQVDPASYERQKKQQLVFLNRLEAIDRAQLSLTDQISYDMFKTQRLEAIEDVDYRTYQMPLTAEWGFHVEMAGLANQVSLNKYADYQNYLELLKQVPVFFEQNISNMRAGMERGFTVPRLVLDGYSDGIKVYIQDKAEDTVWFKPFSNMRISLDEAQQQALKQQAIEVINKNVLVAYKKYYQFFENEYLPAAKKSIAAIDYPNGKDFYQSQIKRYTTLDLSAEEINAIGWLEVKRIRAEMEQVIEETGFEGDFAEFLHFLRTDPQFYAETPEQLLKEAAYMSKKMDHQLPKFFGKLPRQPYGVVPVAPEIAPKYTTGRYSGAPISSDRAGEYWVNTYALEKRPLYNLEALTLHEAVPGHHLQTALAQELTDLPKFRQNTYISAFGEGWGLYSERLGLEAGFYTDPYSNFGRLTYEMWRAMRLVVDTGMHAMGMSRDEAIKLMEENTALSTHNVRTEIDRYISWPGQALSYKLGEIKIRELRAKAEKELGDDFDIRQFHDAVLGQGSVPLSVLEQQIEQFIKQVKAK